MTSEGIIRIFRKRHVDLQGSNEENEETYRVNPERALEQYPLTMESTWSTLSYVYTVS